MDKPKSVDLDDDFISSGEKEQQENADNDKKSKKKKKAAKKDKKVRVNFMLHESTKKKLFHHKAETGRTASSIVDELINEAL